MIFNILLFEKLLTVLALFLDRRFSSVYYFIISIVFASLVAVYIPYSDDAVDFYLPHFAGVGLREFEPGYEMLVRIFQGVVDGSVFMGLVSFATIMVFFNSANRLIEGGYNKLIFLFLIMSSLSMLIICFRFFRQEIALSLLFLSISFGGSKRSTASLLTVIASSMIHYAYVVFVPALLFLRVRKSLVIFGLIVVAPVFALLSEYILLVVYDISRVLDVGTESLEKWLFSYQEIHGDKHSNFIYKYILSYIMIGLYAIYYNDKSKVQRFIASLLLVSFISASIFFYVHETSIRLLFTVDIISILGLSLLSILIKRDWLLYVVLLLFLSANFAYTLRAYHWIYHLPWN